MSEIMRQLWTPQMQLLFTIIILLIVALYALSIVWVGRDARLRGVASAKWMLIALIPGAGIVAYLLLRPPMLAMDRDEQEMEVALKQRELLKYGECATCGYPVKDTYVICPNCQTKLRNLCSHCEKPLEPGWAVCPYCATPNTNPQAHQQAIHTPSASSNPRNQMGNGRRSSALRTSKSRNSAPEANKEKASQGSSAGSQSSSNASSSSTAHSSTRTSDKTTTPRR